MRCLEKAPESRAQRVEDVRRILEALDIPADYSHASRGTFGISRVVAATVALFALVVIAAAWYAIRANRAPTFAIGRITHVTTDPGLELDPALSPDGRTIAYVAGSPGQMRIYLKELAGGRAVPLTEEGSGDSQRWPQWSPDGARIVFQAGRSSLVSRKDSVGSLYLASPLAGSARRLSASVPGGQAFSPSWSPDGSRIVFAGFEGLYTMAVDHDDTPRLLVAGAELHSASWSPDATQIAYVSRGWLFTFGAESLGNVETSAIKVLTLATGRVTEITNGSALETNPVWMPDSRTLLFVSSRGGGRDVYSVRLAADGRPENDPERVTSGVSAHGMSIARDGKLLLYSSYAPSANIWSIRIPDGDPVSVSEALQVTFGNEKIEKLTVSPDGRWLAYDSDVNGPADVWKVSLAGGRPEQLTHGPNHKFVNDWSPDGRELVFHSLHDGQRDLFVVSADGTGIERVTSGQGDEQHAGWGPDGNSIVFDLTPPSRERTQAYIVTRTRRGEPWGVPRQLTTHGSTDPKWSPDHQLIAFSVDGQLRVIAPDGTGERVLVDARNSDLPDPEYPVWSRDSRTLYFKAYDRERQSTIWGVPVAGGPARLLVRFDVPSRRSVRREFATDGQRFYFTVARDESDLWAMQLVQK